MNQQDMGEWGVIGMIEGKAMRNVVVVEMIEGKILE